MYAAANQISWHVDTTLSSFPAFSMARTKETNYFQFTIDLVTSIGAGLYLCNECKKETFESIHDPALVFHVRDCQERFYFMKKDPRVQGKKGLDLTWAWTKYVHAPEMSYHQRWSHHLQQLEWWNWKVHKYYQGTWTCQDQWSRLNCWKLFPYPRKSKET